MADPLVHRRHARSPRGVAIVAVALALIIGAVVLIDAAWWIAGIFLVLTLPAIWDLIRNREATLRLDDATLDWSSGRRAQSVPLAQIDQVSLSTTLDFSQRATVQVKSGEKLRIPPECLPGGRQLDRALDARGISNRRSLFSF